MTLELVKETEEDNQTPPVTEDVSQETPPVTEQKTIYTAEELEVLHPTAIDLERVDPAARPIVERTIKEYKLLQSDHTKKSQELAELKRVPETETYFEDPKKDGAFKDYLKNPGNVLSEINSEITKMEAVIPDDGPDEYRNARRWIAYWTAIKDEFSAKRIEVSERQRERESAETKLIAELGKDAPALVEYAQALGFSEKEFKSRPELRSAVKRMYDTANAANTARHKEVKPNPQKTAITTGSSGGEGGGDDEEKTLMNPDTPTDVRVRIWREQKLKQNRR